MDVTKANNSNIEDILRLNKQIHVDTQLFQGDSLDWVEEQVENGNYFVVKSDNEIYGALCLVERDGLFHLETIAVQEDQQRKGIGRQFMDFAKKKAKEDGFDRLYVDMYCEYNVGKFYERSGFRKIPTYAKYKGKPYHRFVMDLK
jgi:N-acetylglutamate synthase-like GNAT family acetyltransferase